MTTSAGCPQKRLFSVIPWITSLEQPNKSSQQLNAIQLVQQITITTQM